MEKLLKLLLTPTRSPKQRFPSEPLEPVGDSA
jgi:hypothetical protein